MGWEEVEFTDDWLRSIGYDASTMALRRAADYSGLVRYVRRIDRLLRDRIREAQNEQQRQQYYLYRIMTLSDLSFGMSMLGRTADAIRFSRQCVGLLRKLPFDAMNTYFVFSKLAALHNEAGDHDQALTVLCQAIFAGIVGRRLGPVYASLRMLESFQQRLGHKEASEAYSRLAEGLEAVAREPHLFARPDDLPASYPWRTRRRVRKDEPVEETENPAGTD